MPAGMDTRGQLPSSEKCTRLDSLQLQQFGSHKKNQNRCHKKRFTGSKYGLPKLSLRLGLRFRPHWLWELTVLPHRGLGPRPLAVFKVFASQQRRKGRVDMA